MPSPNPFQVFIIAKRNAVCYTPQAMKTILLLTRKESSVFRAMAESISACSKKQGWALHTITVDDSSSTETIAASWNADGCIVYAATPSGLNMEDIDLRIPAVYISPTWKYGGKLIVVHDSYLSGSIAADGLSALGMDHFAFASVRPLPPWAEKRLSTYRRKLSERGRNVKTYPGSNLRAWLKSLPKPCGLFAANDAMAERVVAAAKAEGIEVPFELAVLGCDNDARICEHAETTISSIRPDYAQGGMLAVQMLAAAMNRTPVEQVLTFGDVGIVHRASTRLTAYKSPAVSSALEYIRINAFSGISSADVVSVMKASRRSAENMFRSATGHSILEEIQSVRINEAKRLLSNPLMKISAVAAQTGYGSENFLARLFKRETGMTPRQWRAQALRPATSPAADGFSIRSGR